MRKRNISPERLIEAIKEYIDRKGSFDTIAEKYGISYETIRSGFIRYKENGISTFIETKHNAGGCGQNPGPGFFCPGLSLHQAKLSPIIQRT